MLPSMQCRSQLLVGRKAAEAPTAGSIYEACYGAAAALQDRRSWRRRRCSSAADDALHAVHGQLGFVISKVAEA
jgi:hypothetical protein